METVTVPERLPNVMDRAIRTARARRAPSAVIIPGDVQEFEHPAPAHEFRTQATATAFLGGDADRGAMVCQGFRVKAQ